MSEVLFIRHAQAFANVRDFAAFGNVESPLTERGIAQADGLKAILRKEFGIDPETYDKPVAVSGFTRPQQTAHHAGFKNTEVLPLINESDVDHDITSGVDVIRRHRSERWVPDETRVRNIELIDRIQTGDLDYEIYFTHGMFIAGLLLECDARLIKVAHPFTEDRGYVPLQASVIRVEFGS